MGLRFPGRGRRAEERIIQTIHIAAAAAGGAAAGALLGAIGSLVHAGSARVAIVAAAGGAATVLGLRRRQVKLGRQCQVPRRWARTMQPGPLAAVWGLMLGCGVATLIPHSSFLLLAATQVTAGPALGAASGAVFGAARQTVAFAPVVRRLDPPQTMALLSKVHPVVRRLNWLVSVGGGIALGFAARR